MYHENGIHITFIHQRKLFPALYFVRSAPLHISTDVNRINKKTRYMTLALIYHA